MSETHTRRVQTEFGRAPEAYVHSPTHAAGPDLDRLLAWGRARRPGGVLDVATGGGHTALALAGVAARVVAFDLTEPMLAAARAFLRGRGAVNVTFVAGDVEALPFPDGAFDVVTCRIAAHHFANVGQAVREIGRVVKPGGSFLLEDILGHDDPEANAFMTEIERRRDPSHVRAYRAREWTALLKGAGLTVIDEALFPKVRVWSQWTSRRPMTPEALADLERFVRAGAPAQRAAFAFELDDERIHRFTDRMLLLRADRD
jgi:SAM-dependent methyltransferase